MRPVASFLRGAAAVALLVGAIGAGNASAQSGGWVSRAPMPSPVALGGSGVIGDKLYVAGGDAALNLLQVYDAATNGWALGPSLPTLRSHQRAAVIDGKLYVAGGCDNTDCNSPSAALAIYDPVTNNWTLGFPMPTARGGAAVAAMDGKLYVIGGVSCSCPGNVAAVEIYDPSADSWTIGTPMPTPRVGLVAASVGSKLYAIGGGDPTGALAVVEVYDPVTDGWTLGAPMPTPRENAVAAVIDGKIHVVGGDAGVVLAVHEVYDPVTDSWTTALPLPAARSLSFAGAVHNRLFVGGGVDASSTRLATLEEFVDVTEVGIDIKPGAFPNAINLKSAGVVPVAILSSSVFDAVQVNPATISLAGARVRLIGKGDKYSCGVEDVNADGLPDLVCKVMTAQFMLAVGDSVAMLEAQTIAGNAIRGQDSIRIVP